MRRLLVLLLGLATALGLLTVPTTTAAMAAPGALGGPPQAGTYRTIVQSRVLDTRSGIGGPRTALAPGEVRTVKVAGAGPLPATGLSAVTVNVGVLAPARSGSVTVFPGGTAWTGVGSISFRTGVTVQSNLTAKLGATGTLAFRNNTGVALQLIADVSGYFLAGTPTVAGAFGALALARVLDTRSGIGGPATAVAPGAVRKVAITGHGGVPATGVSAVAVNVGVLAPGRSGSITVFPGDSAWPGTGTISFPAGGTVQSSLTASLGADGTLAFRNNTGVALQLIADVAGYYLAGAVTAAGGYQPVYATRALDTRQPDWGPLSPGTAAEISLAPLFTASSEVIPGLGVAAVSANVGVLAPEVSGSVSVLPGHTSWNRTGSISFPAGVAVQSSVTAALGVDGTLQIRNNTGRYLTVIVDVAGYYLARQAPVDFQPPVNADPRHGMVTSVSCVSASRCVAVEQFGYASVYDGQQWSPVHRLAAGLGVVLNSVSCPTTTFCVAVGSNSSAGAVYLFDGTSWSSQPSMGSELSGVSCPSATFCMAVDVNGRSWRYDGTAWSTQPIMTGVPGLRSLSCTAPMFCAALDSGTRAAMFDGTSWSVLPAATGTGTGRRPVSCVSATFCLAVGPGGSTVYDGSSWSAATQPDPSHPMEDVSCATATSCTALDHDGRALTFDGQSWSTAAAISADPVLLGRLSCSSATACVALSRDSYAYSYAYSGGSWGPVRYLDSVRGMVVGVSCATPDFCMLLDRWGGMRSYTTAGWGDWAEPDRGVSVQALSCASPSFCVAVDSAGRAVSYDGTGWGQPVAVDGTHGLTAVSCASPTSCVAVDTQGRAVSYDAGSWSQPALVDSRALVEVSCPTAQFCAAADDIGRVVTRTAGSWSAPVATGLGSVAALSCASESFCLMTSRVASNALNGAARFDGTTWSGVPTNGYQQMAALSCPSATTCIGVSTQSLATLGFDGTSWSNGSPLAFAVAQPSDISCPSESFCMLASSTGSVSRTFG